MIIKDFIKSLHKPLVLILFNLFKKYVMIKLIIKYISKNAKPLILLIKH